MSPDYQKLSEHLQQLENKLRECQLWSSNMPDATAFNSTAPFCYDSMPFEQWLQWVFIPALDGLIKNKAAYPENCATAPMGEIAWRKKPGVETLELIHILENIDAHISRAPQSQT